MASADMTICNWDLKQQATRGLSNLFIFSLRCDKSFLIRNSQSMENKPSINQEGIRVSRHCSVLGITNPRKGEPDDISKIPAVPDRHLFSPEKPQASQVTQTMTGGFKGRPARRCQSPAQRSFSNKLVCKLQVSLQDTGLVSPSSSVMPPLTHPHPLSPGRHQDSTTSTELIPPWLSL